MSTRAHHGSTRQRTRSKPQRVTARVHAGGKPGNGGHQHPALGARPLVRDAHHLTGQQRADLLEPDHAGRQPRADMRIDIAAVKRIRPIRAGPAMARLVDFPQGRNAQLVRHERERAVVRGDKKVTRTGAEHDRLSIRADTRIDHRHENRSFRPVRRGLL